MKKLTRRTLAAIAMALVLVLAIAGVTVAAGPYNGDCPNDGVCVNDGTGARNGNGPNGGVCPNEDCPYDGECPNGGVCVNDADGDGLPDQLQTRSRSQDCTALSTQTQQGYRHGGYGNCTASQYAKAVRYGKGLQAE